MAPGRRPVAPCVGIDGTRQRAETCVRHNGNIEAATLGGLLKECDVVARVGEPTDLICVILVKEQ
jgi:hypothetical protein